MLKTLRLIALFGICLPCSALAAPHGLVNIRTEYKAFRHDFAANPTVLSDALDAYDCGIARGDPDRHDILTIVDYALPSFDKRLWVLDLATHRLLFHTYVAHGAGSGKIYATDFSNRNNSDESSIGLYETGKSYNGEWGYAMRLYGLERGYNSNAFKRDIVMHGGSYVGSASVKKYGMIGMSDGCLAVPVRLDHQIINTLKNGSFIFAYYPNSYWLATSHFLHCRILRKYN